MWENRSIHRLSMLKRWKWVREYPIGLSGSQLLAASSPSPAHFECSPMATRRWSIPCRGSHHVEFDHYCWKTGEKAFRVGPQFVQIDIQKEVLIVGVGIWCPMPHFGYDVPRDVVVQVSGDSRFGVSTTTVFNCDKDNSLGFGAGSDRRFATSPYGKLIRVSNQIGQYVRIWFDGSARNDSTSQFVEVEVYGRPVPLAHRHEALRSPESYLWQDRSYIIGASALLLACIALLMLVRHIRKKNNKIASQLE